METLWQKPQMEETWRVNRNERTWRESMKTAVEREVKAEKKSNLPQQVQKKVFFF